MQWSDIESELHTLEQAKNGYTLACRGIVTMPDGTRLFAKIGVDSNTKHWAQKEIAVYEFLSNHSFSRIPKFLTHNNERTGFALELLSPDQGWNWENEWSYERLQKTLEAMDQLAAIVPTKAEQSIFGEKGISETANGWKPLAESDAKQHMLRLKLARAGHTDFMNQFDIRTMACESSRFIFRKDELVHNDVRADNSPWNSQLQEVNLIDWNWTQLGDRKIDVNSMLVHVHRSGLDITARYTDRLDADALQWIAGFWLNAAITSMQAEDAERTSLRDYQLESGVAALKLREAIISERPQ